jgi:rhodanese-related sulfurtransferase
VLQLQQLGFTNAYALLGGLNAWRDAKLPTEPAPKADAPKPGA